MTSSYVQKYEVYSRVVYLVHDIVCRPYFLVIYVLFVFIVLASVTCHIKHCVVRAVNLYVNPCPAKAVYTLTLALPEPYMYVSPCPTRAVFIR